MPGPAAQRAQRIKELVKWAANHNVLSSNSSPFDALFQDALDRYPFVREKTLRDYVEVALRIIKEKEKRQTTL